MQIKKADNLKPIVPKEELVFGSTFSDYMLEVDWNAKDGWSAPIISPYHSFSMDPASSVFHYALECFEGMKGYKDAGGNIRLFRPMENMKRMNRSMNRLYMPGFNPEEFLQCLNELLKLDGRWIPQGDGYSIYIRPTAISTYPFLGVSASQMVKLYVIMSPAGPYFPQGFKPIKLLADTNNVRAWPGGVGNSKLGGNYAPTIQPQMEALEMGCQQVMWLFGPDHQITEVGAMNLFFAIRREDSDIVDLVTPTLANGDILPGITRKSIIELVKGWSDSNVELKEAEINMPTLIKAIEEKRCLEMFGAGTAVVVCPVNCIHYQGRDFQIGDPNDSQAIGPITKRVWDEVTGIQYGKIDSEWSYRVG